MSGIRWGEKHDPQEEHKGHSYVQFGWSDTKSYVRCQCGVRLSSKVNSVTSWQRHLRRKFAGSKR